MCNRFKLFFLILAAVMLMLAACTSGDELETAPPAQSSENETAVVDARQDAEPEPETDEPLDPVELVFIDASSDWPEERFRHVLADPVQSKFPHITVSFIPYSAGIMEKLITSGEQVDVVMASTGLVSNWVLRYDLQFDIAPLIEKYDYDLSLLEPSSVALLQELGDGGMYGLPMSLSPATIYYNKDIFDLFGQAYPEDGMTWDETYELARKLTREEGSVQYRGLLASLQHLVRLNQFSLELVNPDTLQADFSNERWRPFIDNITRFYQIEGMNPTQDMLSYVANQRKMFIEDRTAAMWLPVSTQHTQEELAGMNWDLASFPEFPDMPDVGPQPYPNSLWLTSISEHKDEAFQVMAFLTSEQYQLPFVEEGQYISAINTEKMRNAFGANSPMYEGKNRAALLPKKLAPAVPITQFNSIADVNIAGAITQVILGNQDVNTALREAEEKTNQTISEQLGK